MKTIKTNPSELQDFGFEFLSENEMMAVRGGTDARPKTRDRDVYDEEI